jgi:hypothetical protein
VFAALCGTLFQLAVSHLNWIDKVMEDVGENVRWMLSTEALHSRTVDVPDKRSRIREVIVVGCYQPGFWEFGVGREWGGLRKGRSVYE